MEAERRKALGEFIRHCRKYAGITQAELISRLTARGFQYTEGTVASWEVGRYAVPLWESNEHGNFVDALAEALSTTKLALLEAAGFVSSDEIQFDADIYEVANLLRRTNPSQRRAFKELLIQMVGTPA